MIFIRISSFIILLGIMGFVGIVIYLHTAQIDYDPVNQLMSELVLGNDGHLMRGAFSMLALAIVGAMGVIMAFKASIIIVLLLAVAAVSLLGAGIFELGAATMLHIVLVAVAFVLLGLVMYLLPRYVASYQNMQSKLISWGLGIAMALFVLLGGKVIPIGVSQRMGAICIILWLSWLASYALRRNDK